MKIRVAESIHEIAVSDWQTLATVNFPFFDHAYLAALEDSGSIGAEVGWQPLFILADDDAGLAGALCVYVKSHSYGEYIFDWQWAHFFQQCRATYYPKLLNAVPMTPATGPRLLLRPNCDKPAVSNTLVQALAVLGERSKMSSCHALFLTPEDAQVYADQGFLLRDSFQYHWRNKGYRDFHDYADSLIGKRRRGILKERERAQAHGLKIQRLTGSQLTAEHARTMYRLYENTTDKKQATAYLQPDFYTQIFATMASRVVLVLASDGEQAVAAALNFHKGDALFGRYWGSIGDYRDLHFELCYYQTIDYAIEHGLQLFEAGAQGEHKIQRGFLPSKTLSAHLIYDAAMRRPIEAFLKEEKLAVAEAMRELDRQDPFKVGKM